MFVIPNQSSIPKAYTQFTDVVAADQDQSSEEGGSRLKPSDNRDRVVDCMEEFVKYTLIMRQHFDLFNDRFSERPRTAVTPVWPESRSAEVNGAAQQSSNTVGDSSTSSGEKLVNGVNLASV
jgi:arsenic resistance protein ArsH